MLFFTWGDNFKVKFYFIDFDKILLGMKQRVGISLSLGH
jgi:hypothetical protein